MERSVQAAREANASELKKANAQVAEKERALKSIKLALADSPENVVKKLKALKKEKFDEATARKRAEDEAKSLKKEKQNLEKENKEKEETLEKGIKLAEQHRDLYQVSQSNYDSLKEMVKDDDSVLQALPELDQELLDAIAPEAADDSQTEGSDNEDKKAKQKTSKKKTSAKKKKKKSSKK